MITENNQKKAYIAATIFTIIVGFSFIAIKACIPLADPLVILAHRFNIAFLAATIPILFGIVKISIKTKKKSGVLWTAAFYVGFMILQTVGLVFATSIEAGIIFAIIPILAKILSGIFLKEKTTWKQNVFTCISVTAVILMFIFGATDIEVNVIGLVILFLSSLSMAISNTLMRGVRNTYTPYEIAFFIAFFGFIVFNVAALIFLIKTGALTDYFMPLTNNLYLISIIYLGALSTLVSALLMSYMLANMQTMKATIFGNLSTAISIVAGIVILNEPMQIYYIVCTALIIVGVVGVSLPPMGTRRNLLKGKQIIFKEIEEIEEVEEEIHIEKK